MENEITTIERMRNLNFKKFGPGMITSETKSIHVLDCSHKNFCKHSNSIVIVIDERFKLSFMNCDRFWVMLLKVHETGVPVFVRKIDANYCLIEQQEFSKSIAYKKYI